jgi:hypothetical protein
MICITESLLVPLEVTMKTDKYATAFQYNVVFK